MKRVISLLLIAISVIGLLPVFASADTKTISPMYVQIAEVDNGLSPDGNTLYITAATYGYSDATKCGVTATLQKKSGSSWTNYRTWSATSPSSHPDYVALGKTVSVSSGTYRLVTSHSVTVGGYTEYEGMTSDIVIVS